MCAENMTLRLGVCIAFKVPASLTGFLLTLSLFMITILIKSWIVDNISGNIWYRGTTALCCMLIREELTSRHYVTQVRQDSPPSKKKKKKV